MYKCDVGDCQKKCKTKQALLSHKRLKHGIIGNKVTAEEPAIKPTITIQPLLEETKDLRIIHAENKLRKLQEEKEYLISKISEFKTTPPASKQKEPSSPEEPKPQIIIVEQKENHSSGLPIPPLLFPTLPQPPTPPTLPTPPDPPGLELIRSKIKTLNERELFR